VHLTQVAFLAILVAALTAAFARGGRTERIGGSLFLMAALATPLAQSRMFESVDMGIAVVDAALLVGLMFLAFRTSRHWLIVAIAFQALTIFTHVARLNAGAVSGEAYAVLAVLWSYPVLLALLWGSLIEARAQAEPPAADLATPQPFAPVPGENLRTRNRRRPATPDEHALLTRLLILHDIGSASSELAETLLARSGNFAAAVAASPARLASWGIDNRVASALAFARNTTRTTLLRRLETRRAISNGEIALDYLHAELAYLPHEQFRILYLNARYRLLYDEVHGEGSAGEAPVYPREIVKRALEVSAVHVILAHNHPGGDPTPSRADIISTRAIKEALRVIDVSIIDHIVISASGHTSMRASGFI
jgi:DNA repair protein RadC